MKKLHINFKFLLAILLTLTITTSNAQLGNLKKDGKARRV